MKTDKGTIPYDDMVQDLHIQQPGAGSECLCDFDIFLRGLRVSGRMVMNQDTTGRIPLYLAPGVTGVRLTGSTFTGTSNNPAVYLDAESAGNTITGNRFDLADHRREVIAIDGSADNTIADNTFTHVDAGGIFLYRNCGEGGTVRHQTPSGNVIAGNTFAPRTPASAPAIWIGSRGGRLFWRLATGCSADGGLPFGSSADDGDHADGNAVTDNVFIGIAPATAIRDDGNGSSLSGNRAGH